MEPEQTPPEIEREDEFANLKKVTPLSKYLAAVLFIALPFIGGWIGYNFAPEKVVEVERVVEVEKVVEVGKNNTEDAGAITSDFLSEGTRVTIAKDGISLVVPENFVVKESLNYDDEGTISTNISEPSTFTDGNHSNLGLGVVVIDLSNKNLQANLEIGSDASIYDYVASVNQVNHPDAWQKNELIGGREFLLTFDVGTGRINYTTRIDEKRILHVVSGETSSLSEEEIRGVLATLEISSGSDDRDWSGDEDVTYFPSKESPFGYQPGVMPGWSKVGFVKDIFKENGVSYIRFDEVEFYIAGGSCSGIPAGYCVINDERDSDIKLELKPDTRASLHNDQCKRMVGLTDVTNVPDISVDGTDVKLSCSGTIGPQTEFAGYVYYWILFSEEGTVEHIVEQYVP